MVVIIINLVIITVVYIFNHKNYIVNTSNSNTLIIDVIAVVSCNFKEGSS